MGKKQEEEIKKVKKSKDKSSKATKNKVEKNDHDDGGSLGGLSEVLKIGIQVLETVSPIVKIVVNKFFVDPEQQAKSDAEQSTIDKIASKPKTQDALIEMIQGVLPIILTPLVSSASQAQEDIVIPQEDTILPQAAKNKMSLDLPKKLTKYAPEDLTNIAKTIIDLLKENLENDNSLPSVDPNAKVKFKESGEKIIVKAKLVEETYASTRDISLTKSSQIDVPTEEEQTGLAGAIDELNVNDESPAA